MGIKFSWISNQCSIDCFSLMIPNFRKSHRFSETIHSMVSINIQIQHKYSVHTEIIEHVKLFYFPYLPYQEPGKYKNQLWLIILYE